MSSRMEREGPGPFGEAAMAYLKAGWAQVLPIWKGGARDKQPMLSGYHGRDGTWPDETTMKLWAGRFKTANIALRLPRGVIGLDVDDYDTKHGYDVLCDLEEEVGPLPQTVVSTSRDDGRSGIRLYGLPAEYVDEVSWPSQAGPDIEVITWYERYAIVAPSVHATGRVYAWYRETFEGLSGLKPRWVPRAETLPQMPPDWCEYLISQSGGSAAKWEGAGYDGDAVTWLEEYGGGEPCRYMSTMRRKWLLLMQGGGSAHEAARGICAQAVKAVAEGHCGGNAVLWEVRSAFIDVVGSRAVGQRRRGEGKAVAEWRSMLAGAISKYGGDVALPDEVCDGLAELYGDGPS